MRWDSLFDDLEAQMRVEVHDVGTDLAIEEERLRLAGLSLQDRIRVLVSRVVPPSAAPSSSSVRLLLADGRWMNVSPIAFGRDWLAGDLVREGATSTARGAQSAGTLTQCVIPMSAIRALSATRSEVVASLGPDAPHHPAPSRVTLPVILRDLCRRRVLVELSLPDGVMQGTLDRVGSDHLDLAVHEPDSPRRESAVRRYALVALQGILVVRF